MHMSDALLSPAVALSMYAVSGAAIAYSCAKMKNEELSEKNLPVTAIAGAFVFAAQMVNFTIPATGSSGHIGGGILLAALLGGAPALLAMTCVLVIQCLFFADGGLLALGANIFNMGVIPSLFCYPLFFKPILRKEITPALLMAASVISVVIALQLGAFAVVLQTLASGITALPFKAFALLMQPIHLAIGIVEGVVTGAVLTFVWKARPEILDAAEGKSSASAMLSMRNFIATFAVVTLITAAVISGFASSFPDGLEWSIERAAGTNELESSGTIREAADALQKKSAIMPDYDYAGGKSSAIPGSSAAGAAGAFATFAAAGLLCLVIYKAKGNGASKEGKRA